MDSQKSPIQSLLLHGTMIAEADISAYRDVLGVLRNADVKLAFTAVFSWGAL